MFRSLKLRLTLTYLCVASIVTLLAVVGMAQTSLIAESYQAAVSEKTPQLQAMAHATIAISKMMEDGFALSYTAQDGVDDAVSDLGDKEEDELGEAIVEAHFWIDRFSEIAEDDEEVEFAVEIKAALSELVGMVRRMQDPPVADGEPVASVRQHVKTEEARDRVLALIAASINGELEELSAGHGEVGEARARATQVSVAAIVLATIIAFGLGYVTVRGINQPLQELQAAAGRFGDGDLDCRVAPQKLTEFQDMANAFNTMAADIESAQEERETMHKRLAETSRMAGMAEVATGVLHNVGNVLNSVNISVERMNKKIKTSKVKDLSAVSAVLNEHADDLERFVASDQRGKRLPAFLSEMSRHMDATVGDVMHDLEDLGRNVNHIKQIVCVQQSYAKVKASSEPCDLRAVVDDALEVNAAALKRHGVLVTKDYGECGPIVTDRHKVLQIVVNLISNAKNAMSQAAEGDKRLGVSIADDGDNLRLEVEDSGVGIAPEYLTRIFEHGYTTWKNGHGFGLHTGALAAAELGGSLTARSDGPGRGASFRLVLPKKGIPKAPQPTPHGSEAVA